MRDTAERWLKQILGTSAAFREGQWEAIEALVAQRQRVLVVQRTGWGKSLVYFIATRLLRERGAGTTLLISPLLSLMRNQIDAAAQFGLRAHSVNSTNYHDHDTVIAQLLSNQLDLLLISPERLSNDKFQSTVWGQLRHQVGLLVIDEAHCISDWGHDFRPDYRRIMGILDELAPNTPVLGTTATANDRVVADVSSILGTGMNIQRGALTRSSLQLYVYSEPMDSATRLTLLDHLMRSIAGSGIIYCTTTRDCVRVAQWLRSQGHNVKPYYAGVEQDGGEDRVALEDQLLGNQVKALVASVALGMGFDKPDLHFVIHYQQPGNIISYYQQIGRAGRGIENAHIVLMHGPGDEDIQRYFIDTAFPKSEHVAQTVAALANGAQKRGDLQAVVNVRQSTLEKILTHLEVEGIVRKEGSEYLLIKRDAAPDYDRWAAVTQLRYAELAQMRAYIQHDDCLMRFIADALDDPTAVQPCGRCKNCRGSRSKFQPDPHKIAEASRFLRYGQPLLLEARKRYPTGLPGIKKTTDLRVTADILALCDLYEAGWGDLVRRGRAGGAYEDALVNAAAELLGRYFNDAGQMPTWVTAVPSLRRPQLVPDFAARLAGALKLPYQPSLTHLKQHTPQGELHNSFQQAANVQRAFALDGKPPKTTVLLVDDLAQSKWTLAICGDLLLRYGVRMVQPFVLGSAAGG